MKVRANAHAQQKRNTRLRFKRLRTVTDKADRLKGLLKPVSFEEE